MRGYGLILLAAIGNAIEQAGYVVYVAVKAATETMQAVVFIGHAGRRVVMVGIYTSEIAARVDMDTASGEVVG
jgi:Iap family predicted aminopeptidase